MKRILGYICLLMIVCVLFSCSAASEEHSEPASTDKDEASVTKPESKPTPVPKPEPEPEPEPEPTEDSFVKVSDYIPDLVVDLRYGTENNFTGKVIYVSDTLWLRYGTVKKLIQVQAELAEQELYLKVWDGFRPPSAQWKLWDICPDPTYVSDPNKGFSSHSRGNTVDITLVDALGNEVTMPTDFDDFSKLADRDYSDCSAEAAQNAVMLEEIMKKYGFRPYSGEWWHFTDTTSYAVEHTFTPIKEEWYYADCNEYISLRKETSTASEVIQRIPKGAHLWAMAICGDFVYADYGGKRGYVLHSYIEKVS